MKISVKIDKGECFRHGFNAPENEEMELDLDPEMFSDLERNYIVNNSTDGKFGPYNDYTDPKIIVPVIAELFRICPPNLDGFIDAVHRGMAFNAAKAARAGREPMFADLEDRPTHDEDDLPF